MSNFEIDKDLDRMSESEKSDLLSQLGGSTRSVVVGKSVKRKVTPKNLDTEFVLQRHKKYTGNAVQPYRVEHIIEDLAKRYGLSVREMRQIVTSPLHFFRHYTNHVEPFDPDELKIFYIPKFGKFRPSMASASRRMAYLKLLKEGVLNGDINLVQLRKLGYRGGISVDSADFGSVASGW